MQGSAETASLRPPDAGAALSAEKPSVSIAFALATVDPGDRTGACGQREARAGAQRVDMHGRREPGAERAQLQLAHAHAEHGRREATEAALARAASLAPELASGVPELPRRVRAALPFHVLRAELGLRANDLERAQSASHTLLDLAGAQRAPKHQALARWLRARALLARADTAARSAKRAPG